MKRKAALGVGVLLLASVLPLRAQESKSESSKLDLTQPYLLLATQRTSTMQSELNEAAAAGYRVVVGCRTGGGEYAILLEKVAEPPDLYRYTLLATHRTSTMQKELEATASEGFHVLPRVIMGGETEIVAVLENAPGPPTTSEYLLLATNLTGTLQRELREALEQGYEVVGMVRGDESIGISGEHMVVLKKDTQSSGDSSTQAPEQAMPGPSEDYRLLATEKTSTMQKELDKAAAEGYRLLAGSPTSSSEIMMLVGKTTHPPKTFEYKLLATNRPSTLQKELNNTANKGFRLIPQTAVGKRGTTGGWKVGLLTGGNSAFTPDEIVAVMEKGAASANLFQYLVLDTSRTSTMQKEISQAVKEGYEVAAAAGSPESGKGDSKTVPANLIVILEKAANP